MVELACNQAQLSMAEVGLTDSNKAVTLTYVPMHRSKRLVRGYNQAGLLAKALSRRLNLPLQTLLCKEHPTFAQNRLGFDERRGNLKGSITLLRAARRPGAANRLVLVDDVYTTGSTASECARVLKEGLGVDVQVWTFARAVRRQSWQRF